MNYLFYKYQVITNKELAISLKKKKEFSLTKKENIYLSI